MNALTCIFCRDNLVATLSPPQGAPVSSFASISDGDPSQKCKTNKTARWTKSSHLEIPSPCFSCLMTQSIACTHARLTPLEKKPLG